MHFQKSGPCKFGYTNNKVANTRMQAHGIFKSIVDILEESDQFEAFRLTKSKVEKTLIKMG